MYKKTNEYLFMRVKTTVLAFSDMKIDIKSGFPQTNIGVITKVTSLTYLLLKLGLLFF